MKATRRDFLIKSGAALSMAGLAASGEGLGLMSALAQQSSKKSTSLGVPSDYRALVCVFLTGGNDGNNLVVPTHSDANVSNYSAYTAARGTQGLALQQSALLPVSVPRIGGLTYGLHPALGTIAGGINGGVYPLWATGKMAVVTNIGTLVRPMTRQQYIDRSVPRPFSLFAHNDQVNQHQTCRADAVTLTGWGGRISDRISHSDNPQRLIPTVGSMAGPVPFTIGDQMQPVSLSPAPTPLSSVLALTGYNGTAISNARLAALTAGVGMDDGQELVRASNAIQQSAMNISQALNSSSEVTSPFPNTDIGNQLKQIARLIKSRSILGLNRQIFFCHLGGFDTHSGQLAGQNVLLGV